MLMCFGRGMHCLHFGRSLSIFYRFLNVSKESESRQVFEVGSQEKNVDRGGGCGSW